MAGLWQSEHEVQVPYRVQADNGTMDSSAADGILSIFLARQ